MIPRSGASFLLRRQHLELHRTARVSAALEPGIMLDGGSGGNRRVRYLTGPDDQ
jgi:hypothetical protein